MKKIKYLVIACLFVLSLALVVACGPTAPTCPPHNDADGDLVCDSCGEDVPPDLSFIDLSDVTLGNKVYRYDGEPKSAEIKGTLPDGVTVKYEGNGVTDVGSYKVTASFYYTTQGKEFHIAGEDLECSISITKAKHDVSMVKAVNTYVFYDGGVHNPVVTGDLPEGVELSYLGAQSAVGEYTVTVGFVVDEKNYETPEPIYATLTVLEAPSSALGGIKFTDGFAYADGSEVTADMSPETPDGVSFTGFTSSTPMVIPGTYAIKGEFVVGDESYEVTANMVLDFNTSVSTEGLLYKANGYRMQVIGYSGESSVVVIPSTYNGYVVSSIASGAFMGKNIKAVYIPDNVTNIGNNAFRDCNELSLVRMSNSVEVIGSMAFRSTAILEVELPYTVVSIGYGAFESTPLKSMTLPFIGGSRNTSNPYLGYIFGADGYGGNGAFVPETLTDLTLSDSCQEIPAYAFYGCASLVNVNIGEGVKSIGTQAFVGTGITSIFIPDNVINIPAGGPDAYVSPFYGISFLVINLEAETAPAGYGNMWCAVAEDKTVTYATVNYGVKPEEN